VLHINRYQAFADPELATEVICYFLRGLEPVGNHCTSREVVVVAEAVSRDRYPRTTPRAAKEVAVHTTEFAWVQSSQQQTLLPEVAKIKFE
jgi:hypothetical protein